MLAEWLQYESGVNRIIDNHPSGIKYFVIMNDAVHWPNQQCALNLIY